MTTCSRLKPGDTIGILGGGQLGRMLSLAASRLGLKTHIFCPEDNSPAFEVAGTHTLGAYDDLKKLSEFASQCDVITYEFENIPAASAANLTQQIPVRPGVQALETSQDRLAEKQFLQEHGIKIADYAPVDSQTDLENALEKFHGTGVLKTRRFGYDGKGQVMIRSEQDKDQAYQKIGRNPAVLEQFIPFDREVSIIVARGLDGHCKAYDITENHHENHILKTSTVPANVKSGTTLIAREMAIKVITALEYVGVMGVEMFLKERDENGEEQLLVNEIAPRVHNSGHWTQDACQVSQFEQHIRAIAGWPLGSTERHSDVVMQNLIGDDINDWQNILSEPDTGLHLYGKTEARPGRKMGHVNRITPRRG